MLVVFSKSPGGDQKSFVLPTRAYSIRGTGLPWRSTFQRIKSYSSSPFYRCALVMR